MASPHLTVLVFGVIGTLYLLVVPAPAQYGFTGQTASPTLFDLLRRSEQLQQQQQKHQQHQQVGGIISPTANNQMNVPFYAYRQPQWLYYLYFMEHFL